MSRPWSSKRQAGSDTRVPTSRHALEAADTGVLVFTEPDVISRREILDIATATPER